MDRKHIIENLNKATDKAATIAINRGFPVSNKQGTWVGNTLIKKNKSGFYDVLSLDNRILFKDISVFDIATIISQRYTSGEFKTVEKVVELEGVYSKYHTNMLHYLHCMRGAIKRKEYDTMAILEDKFQISEIRAKEAKNSISIFKRLK
jgi:hypothetical protein